MESILRQSLRDIEIICVDDGSTDSSGAILDGYAIEDQRIKVIHRENAGYGAALNVGMDAATGEYIGIVESDDSILPDMYGELYEHAVRDDLDLVKSEAFYWFEKYSYTKRIHLKFLEGYYDTVLFKENRSIFFDFFMNTWTGIYKRDFLKQFDIRHNETPGAAYQDNGFWIQTLSFCRKAKWLNKAFYLYRQDNPAASVKSKVKVYAMSNEYDCIENNLRKERQMGQDTAEALYYCNYYRLVRHRGTFMRIADQHKREFCNKIIEDYYRYRKLLEKKQDMRAWYERLVADPDHFCRVYIEHKKDVMRTLESAYRLYIYGYGTVGQSVFRNLVNMGFYESISCFVTSDAVEEQKIAGIPVRSFRDVEAEIMQGQVVLAVSMYSDAYTEIAGMLRGAGVKSWLIGLDIINYFYQV